MLLGYNFGGEAVVPGIEISGKRLNKVQDGRRFGSKESREM